MADESEPHLVGVERGEIERGGNDARPIGRDQAGTILRHIRRRRRLWRRLLRCLREGDSGKCQTDERRDNDAPDAGKNTAAHSYHRSNSHPLRNSSASQQGEFATE